MINDLNANEKRLVAPSGRRDSLPAEVTRTFNVEPVTQLSESTSELVEYWRVIVRHKAAVLVSIVLGGLVGFLWTLPQTPIYQAHTSVEVQGLNQDFLNLKDVTPMNGVAFDPTTDILTQVKLIESQSLRERAVEKLKEKPTVPSKSFVSGRISAWKRALHLGDNEPATWLSTIRMAAATMRVRSSGATRVMDISADSPDPDAAAEFLNTLVREFIDRDLEGRLSSNDLTSRWLAQQLGDLKINLEKSEDQLQTYASAAGLQMTTGGGGDGKDDHVENVANAKLRVLQSEMLAAQSDRVKAQSKYELVSSAPIDSLPQVVDDVNLRENLGKLSDLRRQRAELKVTLTAENPKVRKVQEQIDEVERTFETERENVVSRIKNDYEAAARRERLTSIEYNAQGKLVNDQASRAVHYDILKREADTNHQIYEAMSQKVKEAAIASAMRSSSYRVVDPAVPPRNPYKPDVPYSSLLGCMAGLGMGVVFVILRERADRSMQQPGDSVRYINLPELGVIPSDRGPSAKRYNGRTLLPSVAGEFQDIALVSYKRRSSLLAESFNDTLTSILFAGSAGMQPQVIALCSASPSEGKSTISSNLALALADINQKVLLIDADMRRPRQHGIFGATNFDGLSSLLKGSTPILACPKAPIVSETMVSGLSLLPSGPAVSNAANLLYSPRFAELIRAVRGEFDYVLIDTPPMLQIADARIIAQYCDTVILVVRAGRTTRDAARIAKQKFQQDGTPILGTILNDWTPGINGYGYDAKYYDRYAKYYNAQLKQKPDNNGPA